MAATSKAGKSNLTSLGGGRYELVSTLGEGGMAAVWRAHDTHTGQDVAVKILHPDIAERRSYRSRFLAEARTMRRLRHPSVLRVFDLGEDGGRPWFTTEIVDGGALIDRLEKQGKIAPLEALDITFQLLQGLQAAHLAGVVHRDVKPDNVLLNSEGGVRLSDFGIARIRNERVDHKTRTGVAMGTVGYMSPEQRESARDVGPAADLYAAGATLFATVTGCEPPDLFAAHIDPKLLDPVPLAVRDVVQRSTAYRPENRYASARAMAEDVAKARDAIAATQGQAPLALAWMERFDALVAEAVRAPCDPEPPKAPSEEDLPTEKGDEPAATPPHAGEAPVDRAPPLKSLPGNPVLPTPSEVDADEAARNPPVALFVAAVVIAVLVVGIAIIYAVGG